MKHNGRIHLVDIPIGGKGGSVWNRLHGEREGICEALLKSSRPTPQARQLEKGLQAHLRKVDDALDRLMAGSYGLCSTCGRSIEDATLEIDPTWGLCIDCSGHELCDGRISKRPTCAKRRRISGDTFRDAAATLCFTANDLTSDGGRLA